jgi:hypothetical protein
VEGATGVSLMPTLRWAPRPLAYYTYDVWFGIPGKLDKIVDHLDEIHGSDIAYTFTKKLATNRVYAWYYVVYYRGELQSFVPYNARKDEYFSFMTILF